MCHNYCIQSMKSDSLNNIVNDSKSQSHIVITQGEATIKKLPDQAWLSISTETRDPKADTARRKNAENMALIQKALQNIGLPDNATKTTSFSLSPEIEWKNGRGIMKGYIVQNQIEIRIDDVNQLSDVIDRVNSTQNTSIRISGLRFSLKDKQIVEAEALKLAVKMALVRSRAIAEGAERSVGEILRIEESGLVDIHREVPFLMRAVAAKGDDVAETPITIGDIEIKAKVTLTVELQ